MKAEQDLERLLPDLFGALDTEMFDSIVDRERESLTDDFLTGLLEYLQAKIAWRGDRALARRGLDVAAALIDRLQLDTHQAEYLLHEGNFRYTEDAFEEAEWSFSACEAALARYPSVPIADALAVSRGALLLASDPESAIAHYQAAIPEMSSDRQRYSARSNLAVAQLEAGHFDEALGLLRELVGEPCAPEDHDLLANAHGNLAVVCERYGFEEEQERHLLQGHALRLQPALEGRPADWRSISISCVNVFFYFLTRGDLAEARKRWTDCEQIQESTGTDPDRLIRDRLHLVLLEAEGAHAEALRVSDEALRRLLPLESGQLQDDALLLIGAAGRARLAAGQGEAALAVFGRLVAECERRDDTDLLYSSLGYEAAALLQVDRAAERRTDLRSHLDRMFDAERNLRRHLGRPLDHFTFSAIHESLHDALILAVRASGDILAYFEIIQLAKAVAGAHRALRRTTVADVAAALPAGTAFLEYDTHGGHACCVIVESALRKAGGVTVLVPLDITGDQVASEVRAFERNLGAARFVAIAFPNLAGIAARLLHPVLARLAPETRHVIVAPAGAMTRLPFHAFPIAPAEQPMEWPERLIHRHAVSYAPSATLWLSAAGRRRKPRSAIVLSHPRSTEAVQSRVFFKKEEATVGAIIDGSSCHRLAIAFSDEQPLLSLLQSLRADILHIATHGAFDARDPAQSGLVLPDRGKDTVLTLDAFARANLEAELIFLSGCDTGRVAPLRNQESLGIMSVLLGGRTTATILSFWPVPATSEVVQRVVAGFYTHWLLDRQSKAEALRGAMLAESQKASVYDWACFGIFGFAAESC